MLNLLANLVLRLTAPKPSKRDYWREVVEDIEKKDRKNGQGQEPNRRK